MGSYLQLDASATTVDNVVVAEADIAAEWGLVEAPAGVGVGWTLVSGTWTAPTPVATPVATAASPLASLSLSASPTLSELADAVSTILAYLRGA